MQTKELNNNEIGLANTEIELFKLLVGYELGIILCMHQNG